MQILGTEIKMPSDSPLNYEPDWRFKVASKLSTEENDQVLPSELTDDEVILNTSRYLNCVKENGNYIPDEYKAYQSVALWYEDTEPQAVRHYLEALLLTDRTYSGISDDLGVDEELINLYEKIFFNIRDEQGYLIKVRPLKLRFAFGELASIEEVQEKKNKANFNADPIEWKIAAVQHGYLMLSTIWGLNKDQTTEEAELQYYKTALTLNRGLILKRTLRGQISNFDLNQAHSNFIDFKRLQHDIESDKNKLNLPGQHGIVDNVGTRILKMMAPKMIELKVSKEETIKQNKALQQKLLVDAKIKKTDIVDHGVKVAGAEINKDIKERLNKG
ncbi:hypothetical protein ACFLQL_00120 [Verrucomicrobiota bacterium]